MAKDEISKMTKNQLERRVRDLEETSMQPFDPQQIQSLVDSSKEVAAVAGRKADAFWIEHINGVMWPLMNHLHRFRRITSRIDAFALAAESRSIGDVDLFLKDTLDGAIGDLGGLLDDLRSLYDLMETPFDEWIESSIRERQLGVQAALKGDGGHYLRTLIMGQAELDRKIDALANRVGRPRRLSDLTLGLGEWGYELVKGQLEADQKPNYDAAAAEILTALRKMKNQSAWEQEAQHELDRRPVQEYDNKYETTKNGKQRKLSTRKEYLRGIVDAYRERKLVRGKSGEKLTNP